MNGREGYGCMAVPQKVGVRIVVNKCRGAVFANVGAVVAA
jgi:hypothetical protein